VTLPRFEPSTSQIQVKNSTTTPVRLVGEKMPVRNTDFWVVTPCSLERVRCFEVTFRLRLRDRRISQGRKLRYWRRDELEDPRLYSRRRLNIESSKMAMSERETLRKLKRKQNI
jgi:hypothetical protein